MKRNGAGALSPSPPMSTKDIQRRVRRQDVDQRTSLDVYFRTAEHIALQAKVFRAEENLCQLYRLLYAYVSLVLDTMTAHDGWTSREHASRARREEARVRDALSEMETIARVIDEAAEVWQKEHAKIERERAESASRSGAPTERRTGTTEAASASGRADSGPRATSMSAVDKATTIVKVVADVPRATDASIAKHSMFGAKLPSASETANAARAAAAQSLGSGDSGAPGATLMTTATALEDLLTGSPPMAPPQGSGAQGLVSAPTRAATVGSSSANRHAHSLLPPPPPPPPSFADDRLAQSIMFSAASVDFQPKVIVQVPTSDEANTDHTRLDTRLKLYGLREKVVRGDGNCQFRAIADQLFRDEERHAECRAVVINQLRRAAEEYAPYVPENYDEYVETMSKDTTWGDHITLQAAADAYGIAMCVISSYRDNFVVEIQPKIKRSARVCWISFWAEVHYNSLFPLPLALSPDVSVA